ncbi:MAG: sodium/proline symporter PutP [Gammaproteobacteria bacterium]|nr:MAG: sodium/proline symporter PutP [Gammaproteobacteria bacterium]
MTMSTPTLITFIIYLVGMLAIGIFAYKLTNNLSDYILGGRKLGSAVTALSAGASDMSAWLLLGLPGAMYVGGLSEGWIALGLVIGAYLNWKINAPRLRVYTEVAGDSITLPDYLENRFKDKSQLLRVISAFIILIFFTFYTSSGMVAGATLFESSFGMDYTDALIIGAVVIVSYTFIGGFLAVCWTDFFQAILMMLALIVAPLVVLYELDGIGSTLKVIEGVDPLLSDWTKGLTLIGFLSLQAWGLGYFGQPHILVRFMAIDSVKSVATARKIGMSWMMISLFGAMLTGFAGIAYFHDRPDDLAKLVTNSEAVFILLTQVVFNPWISGFLLAAILAAIMSTIDSQLLICSGTITEDFYKKFFRRHASEKELVLTGRMSVLLIAILAVWIAQDPNSKVLSLVSYAWAGFGAGFGPVVLFSLLYRQMTKNAALAGMLVGAITVVVWKQLSGGIFELYELLPGFIFASFAIVLVSKFDKEPEQEILDTFDEVKQIVSLNS